MTDLDSALRDEASWRGLVEARSAELGHFLRWAAACEENSPETSLRFRHRDDIKRCRSVLKHFYEPWWEVVVYSCFDSVLGATTAAADFSSPLASTDAPQVVDAIDWPHGSVAGHHKQCGNRGATASLVPACEKATDLKNMLCETSRTFEERFAELKQVAVPGGAELHASTSSPGPGRSKSPGRPTSPLWPTSPAPPAPRKASRSSGASRSPTTTPSSVRPCCANGGNAGTTSSTVYTSHGLASPTPPPTLKTRSASSRNPHPHLPDPADFADESRPRPPARNSTGRSC